MRPCAGWESFRLTWGRRQCKPLPGVRDGLSDRRGGACYSYSTPAPAPTLTMPPPEHDGRPAMTVRLTVAVGVGAARDEEGTNRRRALRPIRAANLLKLPARVSPPMSSPRINLKDFTTRFSAADSGLHGELGGLNFVRKYVSTDNFWSYQSMLGNSTEPFLPKPFGSSPGRNSSLRWWHTLYSFVYVKGVVPGVSTWAVRDTEGDVLEFAACQPVGAGCFARPRTTSRWSNASLFWTGNGTSCSSSPVRAALSTPPGGWPMGGAALLPDSRGGGSIGRSPTARPGHHWTTRSPPAFPSPVPA